MHQAHRRLHTALLACGFLALLAAAGWSRASVAAGPPDSSRTAVADGAQDSVRPPQEIRITARKYSFSPQRVEVQENDLVKVTMEAADIPHSFTIDDNNYRICKRATPGHPAVFEFRADKVGTFPFYCNLTTDPGCKGMRGELVVRPRR